MCIRAVAGVRSEDKVKIRFSSSIWYGDGTQVLRFGGKHLYQLSHADGLRAMSHRHDCVGWWVWGVWGGGGVWSVGLVGTLFTLCLAGIGLVIRLCS